VQESEICGQICQIKVDIFLAPENLYRKVEKSLIILNLILLSLPAKVAKSRPFNKQYLKNKKLKNTALTHPAI
jgi:hypothetical protein